MLTFEDETTTTSASSPTLSSLLAEIEQKPSKIIVKDETTTTAASPPTLSSLPPEIHLKIFGNIDRVSSVCLGLTNRKLYAIHRAESHTVPLTAYHILSPTGEKRRILAYFLVGWMKNVGLVWSNSELKFVTFERKEAFLAADREWKMTKWGKSPLSKKLTKAKKLKILERLRDARAAGGWWEGGVWVDGVENGKGKERWEELDWEGDEDAV
jgi:hypothetical protein